jgi:hypothetical protein
MNYARIGAVSYVIWGLMHIVGGVFILSAVAEGPAQGYAIYEESSAVYTNLAGDVLGYLAYGFVWIGSLVTYIGARFNWKNRQSSFLLNTVLVGLTDLGLIIFLVGPGYVSWGEAAPGLVLFASGAASGLIACNFPNLRVKSGTG